MKNVDYYRLWHRALQLSDRSNWSDEVEHAFGYLSGLEFDKWWELAKPLFSAEVEPTPLVEISSREDWLLQEEIRLSDENPDAFVVMVDLLCSKDQLIKAFKAMLDEKHTSQRGRPAFDDWADDWPLAGRPNVKAITIALDVVKWHRKNPTWKHWQIAEWLGINAPVSQAEGLKDDTSNKELLSAQVSRYLKRGNDLIRGVEFGVFPYNESKHGKID